MCQLHKEMYAEISRCLHNDYASVLMRAMARDIVIKDIRFNGTYANGTTEYWLNDRLYS